MPGRKCSKPLLLALSGDAGLGTGKVYFKE